MTRLNSKSPPPTHTQSHTVATVALFLLRRLRGPSADAAGTRNRKSTAVYFFRLCRFLRGLSRIDRSVAIRIVSPWR